MNKQIRLLPLLLLMPFACLAGNVTPEQARQQAENFLRGKGVSVNMASVSRGGLVYKAPGTAPAYYVFNNADGKGFVIVSGDDATPSVLGYSTTGSFSYADAPEQLRGWLQGYADEIAWLRSTGARKAEAQKAQHFTPVSPLLGTIAWDQTYPYNLLTPCYVGTTHSATGCVATAMAQIMYYHKYPAQGKGQKTYKPETLNQTVSVDFSQSHYDWDAMTPTYDSNSSDSSRQAVALLMRDCGVAVEMAYGEQSGSMIDKWPVPLTTNFSYDGGIGYLNRNYYSQQEWDGIIREEIASRRPVFATGFTQSSGGHAFVFDGYDEEGMIHVNWGWSGMSNGYFRTSALTPPTQGTGGSSGGFNYKQGIIVGIQPPVEGSENWLQVMSNERTRASVDSAQVGDAVTVRLGGKIVNNGWKDIVVDMGFGLYDAAGQLVRTSVAKTQVQLPVGSFVIGLSTDTLRFTDLQPGSYVVRPIVRNAGGKRWFAMCNYSYSKPNTLTVTVDGSTVRFAQPAYYSLEARQMQHTKIYKGVTSRLTATVANTGGMEYSGALHSALFDAQGSIVAQSGDFNYDIPAGDSLQVAVSNAFSVDVGNYYLGLIDENTTKLCEPVPVEVLPQPSETAEMVMARQLAFDDNAAVPADSVALTAYVKATKGVFANDLTIYIYDANGTTIYGSFNPEFVFAEAGDEQAVRFNCTFENGVPGKTYKAQLINLTQLTTIAPLDMASCLFTLAGGQATGISQTPVAQPHQGLVYSMDGRVVSRSGSLSGLKPGLYILNGKKYVVRK